MIVGIVGADASKFNERSKVWAQRRILEVFQRDNPTVVVSGLLLSREGVGSWAIEEAKKAGIQTEEYASPIDEWAAIKKSGVAIAERVTKLVCIAVRRMPIGNKHNKGRPHCQHCANAGSTAEHIQTSGCWVMHRAHLLGKQHQLILIGN